MKKTASRFLTLILALCLAVSVMPPALARDVDLPDLRQEFELGLELQYGSDGMYQARYTGTMEIGNQFAEAVAVYHDKENVLNDLLFTCWLKGDLIDLMDGTEDLIFTFDNPRNVFLPAEGYITGDDVLTARFVEEDDGNAVKVQFRLNPDKDTAWKTAPAETVKEELRTPVTVTSDWLPVPADKVVALVLEKGPITTVGSVDISRQSGRGVPLYGEGTVKDAAYVEVPTNVPLGTLTLDIRRDPESVGTVSTVTVTIPGYEDPITVEDAGDGRWTCKISNLPYGAYNVTVAVTLAEGGEIKCEKECVVDGPEVTVPVMLPATFLNTEVEGNVAVDNLESAIPDSEKTLPTENQVTVVDVKLEATPLDVDSTDLLEDGTSIADAVEDINEAGAGYSLDGDKFVDFVNVVITEHIEEWEKDSSGMWRQRDEEDNTITNTPGLITMRFPISAALRAAIADADGARGEGDPEVTAQNILAFRRHGRDIQPMRKVSPFEGPGANYECYYISTLGNEDGVGAEYITVKANRFSVYAFGVSTMSVDEYTPESYYRVTFETNGGAGVTARSVVRGSTLRLENIVPRRDGWIFTGWYTDPELTTRVTSVKPDKNMTLYAGWQKDMADPKDTGVALLLNTDSHFSYVQGVPGGLFAPTANITRKEAAQMFYNLLRDQTPVAPEFSDVPANEWYADAGGDACRPRYPPGHRRGQIRARPPHHQGRVHHHRHAICQPESRRGEHLPRP